MGILLICVANLFSDTFKLCTEYIRNKEKIFHLINCIESLSGKLIVTFLLRSGRGVSGLLWCLLLIFSDYVSLAI